MRQKCFICVFFVYSYVCVFVSAFVFHASLHFTGVKLCVNVYIYSRSFDQVCQI